MDYVLIIGFNSNLNNYDYNSKYVIGIDRGAFLAYQNNIKLDLAVGDFDSITNEELDLLFNYTKVIKLNPIKDDTDTLHALSLIPKDSNILIIGGIKGKRSDHFIANYLFCLDERIKLIDDDSLIYSISKDTIIKKNEYKFISFFSLDNNTVISLKGFKYNLDNYNLKMNDTLCISNEIISEGIIKLSGKVMVIMSKDDHK